MIFWSPESKPNQQEVALLKRLQRKRKLFSFLRRHRLDIFDQSFQEELHSMYRATGAGKVPVSPAILALATILQGYTGVSDSEVVELTIVDLRWQMVLDCLGSDRSAFSQSTFADFRSRLIKSGMDRRLLERTVEVAQESGAFDWKKLSKILRVAIDSSPLEGAGRVEDTINLLGHAGLKLAKSAERLSRISIKRIAVLAHAPFLSSTSVKKHLDTEWGEAQARDIALQELLRQVQSLENWVRATLLEAAGSSPLQEQLAIIDQILSQDIDPDPGGGARIKQGVAEDRLVSIEDPDMRHGRKSDSKRFNGYKRHIARDLDSGQILACAVLPANQPEANAAPELKDNISRQRFHIGELHCDRGYISSCIVSEIIESGGQILCKPWASPNTSNREAFKKSDFKINLKNMTITCPAGETEDIDLGLRVKFDDTTCYHCHLREFCTANKGDSGRTVQISEDEVLQQRLKKQSATRSGRQRLRERTKVEHGLAHIGRIQGKKSRYRGTRKNTFDLNRAATVFNLEVISNLANAS